MAAHFHARLPSGASTLGGALYMAATAMESISGEVHACSDLKRYVGVTKRLRNRSACAVCSQAKVRCDGNIPCSRCLRLSHPCRPQSPLIQAEPTTTLLDIAFQQVQSQEIGESYMDVFRRVSRDFLLDRESVYAVLRTWMRLSELAGRDVSWTVGDSILKTLRSTGMNGGRGRGEELVCQQWKGGRARADAVQARSREASEFLKRSESFRYEDDSISPMCMFIYTSLPPCGSSGNKGAPSAAPMSEDDELFMVTACNDSFYKAFTTMRTTAGGREGGLSPTMFDEADVLEYKTSFFFLLASLVRQVDRAIFLQLLLEGLHILSIHKRVEFVKMYNAEGLVHTYIVSSKKVWLREGGREGAMGGLYAHVLKLEVAPISKHLRKNAGRKALLGERGIKRSRIAEGRAEADEMDKDGGGEMTEEAGSLRSPSAAGSMFLKQSIVPLQILRAGQMAETRAIGDHKIGMGGGGEEWRGESKCTSDCNEKVSTFGMHGMSLMSLPLPALQRKHFDEIVAYMQRGGGNMFAIPDRSVWFNEGGGGVPEHLHLHQRLLRRGKNRMQVSLAAYRGMKSRQGFWKVPSNAEGKDESNEQEWRQIEKGQVGQDHHHHHHQQQQQQQQQQQLQHKYGQQQQVKRHRHNQLWQQQLQQHQQPASIPSARIPAVVGPLGSCSPLSPLSVPSSFSVHESTPPISYSISSRCPSPSSCNFHVSCLLSSRRSSPYSSCSPVCGACGHNFPANNNDSSWAV